MRTRRSALATFSCFVNTRTVFTADQIDALEVAMHVLRFIGLPLVLSLIACGEQAGSQAESNAALSVAGSATKTYPIEDFIETLSINHVSLSADESKVLFSANRDGVWNVYSMPVDGGEWTPLTHSVTDNAYAVEWFPEDDRVLFTRDRGGDERNHLFLIDNQGVERDLTPGESLKARFMGFSGNRRSFYVATNERDPRWFDLYRYRTHDYQRDLVFQNDTGFELSVVSPNGRYVVLKQVISSINAELHLWDADTATLSPVSRHEGPAQFQAQEFSVDSATLFYTSNERAEFMRLRSYDVLREEHTDVLVESWDVVSSTSSPTGRYRVNVINADARQVTRIFDGVEGRELALPELPAGEVRGIRFSAREQRVVFLLNGDRQPNDIYVHTLGSQAPVRLTQSLSPKINPADLVDAAIVRFKSFDGLTIPNVLWKPQAASANNRHPALIWVHGGPGGQTTVAFNAMVQYLVNHGYVVLGINNRGSSGYGRSFLAADDLKHGREPLWDTLEARKYLQSLDYVDPDRIGIAGGSYGGYMVLAALTYHPDEFQVGIDIFGVSNWIRTLESIPPWWSAARDALYQEIGNPETQRDYLMEISPVFHAAKIRKPLMVLQGANDPRVLQVESDEIVAAVRANGVPVEYIVFPDEGHGFTKKANQINGYGAMLAFLDRYLKPSVAAAQVSGEQ
jgi:dipeptidyl aminopeptidase/acylaminoacyl peptidase